MFFCFAATNIVTLKEDKLIAPFPYVVHCVERIK